MPITPARTPDDYAHAQALVREYAGTLGEGHLCLQDLARELDALDARYGPPGGALLLAKDEEERAVGIVALRALGDGVSEMKRLYVRPDARGTGLGRQLAEALVETAQHLGYRAIRLDTLGSMTQARHLYRALGFVETPPYYPNPLPDVVCMALALDPLPEPRP